MNLSITTEIDSLLLNYMDSEYKHHPFLNKQFDPEELCLMDNPLVLFTSETEVFLKLRKA